MRDVGIVVFEGVEELDAIGPYEVLRLGIQAGAPFECALVALGGVTTVRAAHGLRFQVERAFDEALDTVIVPGGGWVSRSTSGAWAEAERGELPTALAEAARRGAVMASVCTGALLLARAGLVAGRRMTTHHNARAELASFGAEVVDERVVDDGELLSCGGVSSGLDLAGYLLERECAPAIAEAVAEEIEYRFIAPQPH